MAKYILGILLFFNYQLKAEEFRSAHGKCFFKLQKVLQDNFRSEAVNSKKIGLDFFNHTVHGNLILHQDDNGALIVYGANKQTIKNRGCEVDNSENAVSLLANYLRGVNDILKNKTITLDHEIIQTLGFCKRAEGEVGEVASAILSQVTPPSNLIKQGLGSK